MEFGAKVNKLQVDGISFIQHISYEAFNESTQEREELLSILNKGKHTSQQFKNACILLNSDEGEYGDKLVNEQIS